MNGQKLFELRTKAGLTQKELGEKARLTNVTISNLERGYGNPSRVTIGRLALALGIEPALLIED